MSTIIPALLYRDTAKAVEWLCETIGFEKHQVFAGDDGKIMHAELKLGNGMVMLGSVRDEETEYSKLIKQPDEIGGFETQSVYIVVPDADVVYEKVKTSDGEIVIDIKDEDYGGRDFTCRDVEGHVWTIGTYDPWKV
ncbi:VOC family protein [Calycomorphotria hydatis]|uniref:Glyoxalase-like domain protein n=1 Tax=Calycomorphotria hydatis TaxID=2528027 RepID=A0A517T6V7_9PLAN|nr:VOC family protein [Calycomorphotria hydatis]QDT64109.1 Glyoxalase-like domain protein [Calycomorphotria hydatis]